MDRTRPWTINWKSRARLKKLGRSILAFSTISTLSSFVVLFISRSQSCRNIGSLRYITVRYFQLLSKVQNGTVGSRTSPSGRKGLGRFMLKWSACTVGSDDKCTTDDQSELIGLLITLLIFKPTTFNLGNENDFAMVETNEIYQSFYTIDMYKKSKVFQRSMGKQGLGKFFQARLNNEKCCHLSIQNRVIL